MAKSFKQIYAEDKDALVQEEVVTTIDEASSITITPGVEPVTVSEVKIKQPVIEQPAVKQPIVEPQTVRVELTEEIADVLTEQREQSAAVLESVMKTNTKIANSITKLVKGSTETNKKLIEAITALTDKIELLEAKLEALEDLKIPTPIVNLHMPNTKVVKEIHRDKRGLITHVTESEVEADNEAE